MDNRDVITRAFDAWARGDAYVTEVFDEQMSWEIVGRSAASRSYADKAEFVREVLEPFGRRFATEDPFRPVRVRSIVADDTLGVVVVIWDGRGSTVDGTTYENTYAWVMTLRDGLVVDGTAFYDSIAFDELWNSVQERR